MTVAEVAAAAQVSLRTVQRDLAAGRLRATRGPTGRLFIRRADAERYRFTKQRRRGVYWTPKEYAFELHVTVRTVQRWMAKGYLVPVRESARRIYITNAASKRFLAMRFFTPRFSADDVRALIEEDSNVRFSADDMRALIENVHFPANDPWALVEKFVRALIEKDSNARFSADDVRKLVELVVLVEEDDK